MKPPSIAALEEAHGGVAAAEAMLAQAQEAHEKAFRVALFELFQEYSLAIAPCGSEGCRLEIVPLSQLDPRDFT